MVKKVVIDTNVIIDHLRLVREEKSLFEVSIEDPSTKSLISSTTIQELFVGQSSLKGEQETKIRKIINTSFAPLSFRA